MKLIFAAKMYDIFTKLKLLKVVPSLFLKYVNFIQKTCSKLKILKIIVYIILSNFYWRWLFVIFIVVNIALVKDNSDINDYLIKII